jgi:hypothetical protein
MRQNQGCSAVLYASAITLGAFLLFQLQPIAAKTILPWFGGSAGVWSTCLLFFQAVLLLGYIYAAWIDRYIVPRRQVLIHVALLAVSVVLLPIAASIDWTPREVVDPAARILGLLTATIGLPYFLLSTTGPLLQAWYRKRGTGTTPYRFYALSNAASLLALVTYPFAVEPFLSKRSQGWIWATAYIFYVFLYAVIALQQRRPAAADPQTDSESVPEPGWAMPLLWISLAACASALMVSTTSHLSQNVAPVPLLWIAPLSLYLLSFIVCFAHDRAYWRVLWLPLAAAGIGGMAYGLFGGAQPPILLTMIAVFTSGLFACCMFCHGELARSKPHPQYLTAFYVASALGGAAGSLFAGLLAPRLFTWNRELPVALIATAAMMIVVLFRAIDRHLRHRAWHLTWVPIAVGLVMYLGVYIERSATQRLGGALYLARNFYGTLRVSDSRNTSGSWYKMLLNGIIVHGAQYTDPGRMCEPITYYAPSSGIGSVMRALDRPANLRVGVIGLGTGTMAGYALPGDYFRFYEINPLVSEVAKTHFTYIDRCAAGAKVEIAEGDARLSLEREPIQQFDLIVMDAFSGDSIPVHLITKEAFALYFRHLKDSGVLAVHISNRYFRLQPILERLSHELGKNLRVVDSEDDGMWYSSSWGLIGGTEDPATLGPDAYDDRYLWTDDYSAVWEILKWRERRVADE